jgi:hypothetical protein
MSNETSFMSLCNWKRRKYSKVARLKVNNNHGHEFEPNEDSEEAVQGNI